MVAGRHIDRTAAGLLVPGVAAPILRGRARRRGRAVARQLTRRWALGALAAGGVGAAVVGVAKVSAAAPGATASSAKESPAMVTTLSAPAQLVDVSAAADVAACVAFETTADQVLSCIRDGVVAPVSTDLAELMNYYEMRAQDDAMRFGVLIGCALAETRGAGSLADWPFRAIERAGIQLDAEQRIAFERMRRAPGAAAAEIAVDRAKEHRRASWGNTLAPVVERARAHVDWPGSGGSLAALLVDEARARPVERPALVLAATAIAIAATADTSPA